MDAAKTRKKSQNLRNIEYYDSQATLDKLYQGAKEGKTFTNLMPLIASENNIMLAYRNIKDNKGSETRGTDYRTIADWENLPVEEFVAHLQDKLQNYQAKSVRRVEIPKSHKPKETRPLGIPCMDDRLVQQCIKQVIEPICEAQFHNHSYGFRSNRSQEHAYDRLDSLINIGYHYVVDIDIKGFFDNVDHGKLLKQLWTLGIRDKTLLSILSTILKSEIEGIGIPEKGTPQGGIISPLLSNIVLNELDWWLSNQWETIETRHQYAQYGKYRALQNSSNLKQFFFVRYADDFKIVCKDYLRECPEISCAPRVETPMLLRRFVRADCATY